MNSRINRLTTGEWPFPFFSLCRMKYTHGVYNVTECMNFRNRKATTWQSPGQSCGETSQEKNHEENAPAPPLRACGHPRLRSDDPDRGARRIRRYGEIAYPPPLPSLT